MTVTEVADRGAGAREERSVRWSGPAGWPRRVLVVAVLVVAAACGGGSSDDGDGATGGSTSSPAAEDGGTEATTEPEAPFEVDEVTETFVDASRPTDAGSETPAQPDRTLVTRIVHPTGGGPYPLIVMSHGATGHPDEYAEQIPVWAADGFVVAAPEFPLTNRDVPGGMGNVSDVVNQPADVSFVIDEVLAAGDDPSSPLHGLVDPEAIGVVGHSLGGATTWAVSYDTVRRDDRIDSTVIFAAFVYPMPGGELDPSSGPPLLVFHGDADNVPMESSIAAYEEAAPPKWFVTLLGAEHRLAFTDEESPYDELVTTTVLDFWHGTLDGDDEALGRVTEDATDPELSVVLHEEAD